MIIPMQKCRNCMKKLQREVRLFFFVHLDMVSVAACRLLLNIYIHVCILDLILFDPRHESSLRTVLIV
jgi:hypothetical protein